MIKATFVGLDGMKKKISGQLKDVADRDKVLRTVATTMCGLVAERIHEKGLNANGANIGEYSEQYQKIRRKKGLLAGKKVLLFFTRQMVNDFSIGKTSPIKTDKGWGLGFKNKFNAEKAEWAENGTTSHTVTSHTRNVKGKQVKIKSHNRKGRGGYGLIYGLTRGEKMKALDVAIFETNKILKNK